MYALLLWGRHLLSLCGCPVTSAYLLAGTRWLVIMVCAFRVLVSTAGPYPVLSDAAAPPLLEMLRDIAEITHVNRSLVHLALRTSCFWEPISGDQWSCICQLQSLTHLRLHRAIKEGDLRDIGCLTNLRELWLSWGSSELIRSNGMMLRTHLVYLHIGHDVAWACLHYLAAFSRLRTLELFYSSSTLSVPLCLSGLQSLTNLGLSAVTLTDR